MLGKGLSKRWSVIDDDVVLTEAGFCKMTTVSPAENLDLIMVTMKLYVRFVNQGFFRHLSSP